MFAKLAEDGKSLAYLAKSPLARKVIQNQKDSSLKELADCIIEDSNILDNLSAPITNKTIQLLESKKGLFSLMEQAMRQPITSKTQRYITASFCSKGKPVWDCHNAFTSSMYFIENPLKEVFSCAMDPTECDEATFTLSYDPGYYEQSQLHVINVSNNLSFLQLFLKVFGTLAWLDVTSYFVFFIYWIALYSSKIAPDCVGQNSTPCTETVGDNTMDSTKFQDPLVHNYPSSSTDFDKEKITNSTTESTEIARKGQRESVQISEYKTKHEDYPMENLAKESKTNNTGEEEETDLGPN